MPIDVSCPKCGAGLPVPDEFAGRTVRCGGCAELITVPGAMPPPLPGTVLPPPLPGAAEPPPLPQTRPVARAVPVRADSARPAAKSESTRPAEPAVPSKSPFNADVKHDRAKPQTKTALFVVAGLLIFGCCGMGVVGYAFVRITNHVADAGGKNPSPSTAIDLNPRPPIVVPPPVVAKLPTKDRPTPPMTPPSTPPTPRVVPGPVPPPTDPATPKAPSPQGMKGLQLYVSFNADPIREDNSRRTLPVEGKPSFREGVNRNSARLVAIPNRDGGEPKFACDLTAFVNGLRVAEDAPFTIALWVKGGGSDSVAFAATQASLELSPRLFVRTDSRNASVELYCDEADSEKKFVRSVARSIRDINAIHHVALTRDAGGSLTVFYNGSPVTSSPPNSLPAKQTGELKFQFAGFGLRSERGISTTELDEFCAFDRALTADEIKTLAGKGKADEKDKK